MLREHRMTQSQWSQHMKENITMKSQLPGMQVMRCLQLPWSLLCILLTAACRALVAWWEHAMAGPSPINILRQPKVTPSVLTLELESAWTTATQQTKCTLQFQNQCSIKCNTWLLCMGAWDFQECQCQQYLEMQLAMCTDPERKKQMKGLLSKPHHWAVQLTCVTVVLVT